MNLLDVFKWYSNCPFVFVKLNGGNWGDNLIRMGAEKLAKEVGLNIIDRVDSVINKEYGKDIVFYVHGCGGIGATYTGVMRTGHKEIREKYPDSVIIIGPTTAMISDNDLEQLKTELSLADDKTYFFARELTTFEFMKKNFPKLNVLIDHCPSLYLTGDDFTFLSNVEGGSGRLFLMREDRERVENNKVWFEYDVEFNPVDPCVVCSSFEEWVNLHNSASHIITDRLHSAILGCVLGKKVTLMPNYYHKNRSVWEYSLKDRGVEWVE